MLIALALAFFTASSVAQHDPWDPGYPGHGHHDEGYYYADGTENPAALTDGNPASSTGSTSSVIVTENALPGAFAAVDEFPELDDGLPETAADSPTGQPQGTSSVGLIVGRGKYTAGNTDGEVNAISVPYSMPMNERLTFKAVFPISYTRVKDTNFSTFPPSNLDVWSTGVLLSGSYGIAIPADRKDYRWKVTPTIGLTVMDAAAIDVGNWSLVGGLSSNFLYKVSDKVILNIGNSVTAYYSQKWRSDYNPLGRSSQTMLVNGIQAIFPMNRWVANVFVVDNRYLQDAAVKDYQTYGVGGGYRVGKSTSIRVFYYTDQGSDYEAHSFGFSSAWKF
jgi:hypothetical protein